MSSELVSLERPSETVAVVTMDNPELHNQGSWAAIDQLANQLRAAREGGARVAVIASALPGHWLHHAYLRDLLNTYRGKPTTGNPMCWMAVMAELAHTELIVIAAINGNASGGGAEIAWACDLRVAEEGVGIAQIESRLGVAPGMGGASRLSRLAGRSIAAEMALGGGQMTAERLYQAGVMNRLVGSGEAVAEAVSWATQLASFRPEALRSIKQQLNNADNLSLAESLTKEQQVFQSTAFPPEGQQSIEVIQNRLESGEQMAAIYGWER